jgi:AraC-like DNA-binding protein
MDITREGSVESDTPSAARRKSPALVQSRDGDIRVGPILAIPAVLDELGVDPQRAFAQAGVSLDLFRDPDSRMGLGAAGRLFQISADLTECPHFALLVGNRFELKGLGLLGDLMRHSPSVGDALRSLLLHLHLHDRGAAPLLLAPDRQTAILGYSVYRHGTPATEYIYDVAIAIGNRILLGLCGSDFRPAAVQFSYRRPNRTAAYRRVFGVDATFDAEVSGIVFASSWLSKPIAGADRKVHCAISALIRDAQATGPLNLGEQVELVLHQLLLSGQAKTDAVSKLFGISERTLRRRLGEEGRSLQNLVNTSRFELARQLLRNTRLPVAEIAAALHYADANAFSRAFRNWAKRSPSQWRANSAPDCRPEQATKPELGIHVD